MKKALNFRPVAFLCILFALGIFIGKFSLTDNFLLLIILLSLGLLFLALYLVVYFFKLKQAFFLKLFKLKFFILFAYIAIALGFLIFNVNVTSYNSLNIEEKIYPFTGTVYDTFKESDYITLILENIEVLDGENIVKLKQKSLLTFPALDEDEENKTEFRAGQTVNGIASLKNISLLSGKDINTFGVKNGLKYYLYAENPDFETGKASFFANLRQSSKDILKKNLDEEIYPTAYALIFGDTSEMKQETKEAFQKTGLAHVLAVSGLHVGFLMAILLFIFRKLKLKYHYQLIISVFILLFYAAVCGFSPSIIRAALMTLIYLLSKAFGKQYDILSSLFLSSLIILTFSPMYLFDAGFLMSFFSVFSIILLNPVFLKCFKFMPKFLRNGVSISLSAQIGVLPFLAYFFNYVPLLSIFLNVLAIPLINIAFICVFILLLFSAIPYIGFLFAFPQVLLKAVLFLTNLTASISFINLELIFTGGFLIYFLIVVLISNLVLIKKKFKAIGALVLSAGLIINLVLINLPNNFSGYKLTYYDIKSDIYSITSDGNFYLVLGGSPDADCEGLTSILKIQKVKNIKGIIIYKTTDNYLTLISGVLKISKIENVYIRESLIGDDVVFKEDLENRGLNVEILNYKEPVQAGDIRLTLYGSWVEGNGRYNALYVDLYNYSILFTGSLNKSACEFMLSYVFLSPQIIVAENYIEELYIHYKPQAVITGHEPLYKNEFLFSKQTCGELIFEIKDGIIKRK